MSGKLIRLLCLAFISMSLSAQQSAPVSDDTGRRVSVGSYKLYLDCTGEGPGPTVILIGSAMHDTHIWDKVQPSVATFAKVCSYDRMGVGKSDTVVPPRQTAWEIVEDLHTLLVNAGIKPPYVLVGHSIGGIYARMFTEAHPETVAGLVFLDSAHEEQVWRFEKISHSLLLEYPAWPDMNKIAQDGFLLPGGLLQWHDDVPLIVVEHGILWPRGTFKGMTEAQYGELRTTLDAMQLDLSMRSKYGELRIAEKSGHYIHTQQPELVIQAVRDVLAETQRLGSGASH